MGQAGQKLPLAARSRGGDAALRMRDSLVEVAQEQLGCAEPLEGIGPAREHLVGQIVDDRERLGAVGPRLLDRASLCGGEGRDRRGARRQGRIAERPCRLERREPPLEHPPVLRVQQGVPGEVEHQRNALHGVALAQLVERALEPVVGVAVAAKELLDRGAGGDQSHPRQRLDDDLDRLEQRRAAGLQPAGCGLGLRHADQQLGALARWRRGGQ
jgi:hypothetical protein